VFEPDSPFQLFKGEGQRATGPGIGDDKGGIVVIVAALRALHQAGLLAGMDVTVCSPAMRNGPAPRSRLRAAT
jgi:glutamate carboxypeptidase